MKTPLEQGWHYLNNLNDLDYDSGVCFYKEDIDKAINIALQDFANKIQSELSCRIQHGANEEQLMDVIPTIKKNVGLK